MIRDAKYVLFLAVVSLVFLLALPLPEFPMNDEWMFYRSVNIYLDTGRIVCDGCTVSGTLLVSIGSFISEVFGFGFATLRYFVIATASATVVITYLTLRKMGGKENLSLLVSAFLLTNPIFFNMSHLFTTDVPFLFLVALSAYLGVSAIKEKSGPKFFMCGVSASASVLMRQFGLAIPVAMVAYAVLFDKSLLRNRIFLISVLLPLVVTGWFMFSQLQATGSYYSQEFDVKKPIGIGREGLYYFWSTIIYIGFFFSPLAIYTHRYLGKNLFRSIAFFLAVTALASWMLLSPSIPQAESMPYLGNILNKYGLGTVNMLGEYGKEPVLPAWVWFVITSVSIAAASVISFEILSKVRQRKLPGAEAFLLILVGIFLLSALLKVGGFYDRYIMVFIPLLSFIMLQRIEANAKLFVPSIIFVLITGAFSFVMQLDYIVWENVRWGAIADLNERGINSDQINGGFEYCLYIYGMQHQYEYWKEKGVYDHPGIRHHDWKFCPGQEYLISFSDSLKETNLYPSYYIYRSYPYCLAPGFLCDTIYVLKTI
jgi:4-amino-4-deoxy-L-arabinose transferase-like glycosyltransferase